MSVEAIPVEILLMILRNLKGTEAAACRAVCRRWRDAVDSFTDDVWQHFCFRDFWNPKRAKDVSNLSYRDLYKSLTLWSKVGEAEETCPTKPVDSVTHFKVLNNSTVAVSICDFISGFLCTGLINNVIEYYNIQTMMLVSRKTYNFSIRNFDENEKLIALQDSDRRIHVIIKSNGKEFIVGDDQNEYFNNFTLMDTELYFKNSQDMLCVARLKFVDGEEIVETEELDDFEDSVVAFARASDGGLNILTDECDIYCYRNKDFEHCSRLYSWMPSIIYELSYYGFHWSDENIYRWLSSNFVEEDLQITKLKSAAIHAHNHVVLLGTSRRSVHVYKRPYKKNNELKLYSSRPDRIIDINKCTDTRYFSGDIQKLDVVETLYGHRLLVMCSRKLFCIDLTHKQLNVTKKRAPRLARAEPLKRVYMTRSMDKCLRNNKKPRLL